jgi:hypothetical protein
MKEWEGERERERREREGLSKRYWKGDREERLALQKFRGIKGKKEKVIRKSY